jgi:hypothetical protein
MHRALRCLRPAKRPEKISLHLYYVVKLDSKILPQLAAELDGQSLPQPVPEIPWGHKVLLLTLRISGCIWVCGRMSAWYDLIHERVKRDDH